MSLGLPGPSFLAHGGLFRAEAGRGKHFVAELG